jgi:hypothetical protein
VHWCFFPVFLSFSAHSVHQAIVILVEAILFLSFFV